MASQQLFKESHDIDVEAGRVLSPSEITEYRQMAQQNSNDSVCAAEERYAKAKESGAAAAGDAKNAAIHGLGATGNALGAGAAYVADKGVQAAEYVAGYVAEKGVQAKDAAVHGAHVAANYTADKAVAAKDLALEKSQQAYQAAKDTVVNAGSAAAEKTQQIAGQAKDFVVEKTVQAKDATLGGGKQVETTTWEAGPRTVDYLSDGWWEEEEKEKESSGLGHADVGRLPKGNAYNRDMGECWEP